MDMRPAAANALLVSNRELSHEIFSARVVSLLAQRATLFQLCAREKATHHALNLDSRLCSREMKNLSPFHKAQFVRRVELPPDLHRSKRAL